MSVQLSRRRRMPFTLSAGLLLVAVLTACPRPVNNPADPGDDPTAGATKTRPEDGDTIEPAASPPADAGPPTPVPGPPAPPAPEPSPSNEDAFPIQPSSPPPAPKNAPLSV
jgi:hypothetical protein